VTTEGGFLQWNSHTSNVKNGRCGGKNMGSGKHCVSACCQIIHVLKLEFMYLEWFNIWTVSIAPFLKYNFVGTGWVCAFDNKAREASLVLGTVGKVILKFLVLKFYNGWFCQYEIRNLCIYISLLPEDGKRLSPKCPSNTKTNRLLPFKEISQNTHRPIHCLTKYTVWTLGHARFSQQC